MFKKIVEKTEPIELILPLPLKSHVDLDMPEGIEWGTVLANHGSGVVVLSFKRLLAFNIKFCANADYYSVRDAISEHTVYQSLNIGYSEKVLPFSLSTLASLFPNSLSVSQFFGSLPITLIASMKSWDNMSNCFKDWKSRIVETKYLDSYDLVVPLSKLVALITEAISNPNKTTEEATELAVFDRFISVSGEKWRDEDNTTIDKIATEFQQANSEGDKSFTEYAKAWINERRDLFQLKELEKIAHDVRVANFCARL